MKIINSSNNNLYSFIDKIQKKRCSFNNKIKQTVENIINDVKKNGDKALKTQIEKFDNWSADSGSSLLVDKKELKNAYDRMCKNDMKTINSILVAKKRIEAYHQKQKQKSWLDFEKNGSILGVKVTPINKAGLYIPGGKASYPSTLLMNGICAKVAGVENIIVCTPAIGGKISDILLSCCYICEIDTVFKIGGAGAIGAMTYGTRTIPKVDIISGPGNIYVALAKSIVFGDVGIDMIAGPSEIGIIADKHTNVLYTSMDLLSQNEHDELASSVLITHCQKLANGVNKQIKIDLKKLKRKEIASKSIKNNSYIIKTKNINESIKIANYIAFEHLQIVTKKPWDILPLIKNAGAIFLGEYSPEAIGDYIAGPNHTLPTNASAKFFSPLSVDTFMKKSSIISFSKQALRDLGKDCVRLANIEGLQAHSLSVSRRLKDINKK